MPKMQGVAYLSLCRQKLFTETVSADKGLFAETFSVDKNLFAETPIF